MSNVERGGSADPEHAAMSRRTTIGSAIRVGTCVARHAGCIGASGPGMTITYDPKHPKYFDEADVRNELTRVFDVCHGCQLCVTLCTSFPTLFEMIDRHDDHDAGTADAGAAGPGGRRVLPVQVVLPQLPVHSRAPRVGDRLPAPDAAHRCDAALATVRSASAIGSTDTVMGHTDLVGKAAVAVAPSPTRCVGAKQGSCVRKAMEMATGVSSVRLLPPYARQRFTTWFKRRPRVRIAKRQGRVAVFPTCVVEYQQPSIGHDLVKVYERNGIECSAGRRRELLWRAVAAQWRCRAVHQGRHEERQGARGRRPTRQRHRRAPADVRLRVEEGLRRLRRRDADAELVADAHLRRRRVPHEGAQAPTARRSTPTSPARSPPRHLPHPVPPARPRTIGLKSRDLIKLTGARVTLVQQCSGIDGTWGLRAENAAISVPIAAALGDQIGSADGEVVAGDCHLANTAITEQTGRRPSIRSSCIARAYGIERK